MNREGWDAGKYLVYRLYTEEGLSLQRMMPAGKFASDQLQDGTRSRALTIVDVFTREAVSFEIGQSLKGDLANVLVSKYADHLPLYRKSEIYARAGVDLACAREP